MGGNKYQNVGCLESQKKHAIFPQGTMAGVPKRQMHVRQLYLHQLILGMSKESKDICRNFICCVEVLKSLKDPNCRKIEFQQRKVHSLQNMVE